MCTTPSPQCIPCTLSPTPPQYPAASPLPPSRRRVINQIRASYPLPTPPDRLERPRTAPAVRHRQKSLEGRHAAQLTRREDRSCENHGHGGLEEPRVTSAPVNSKFLLRYIRLVFKWFNGTNPKKTCAGNLAKLSSSIWFELMKTWCI